MDAGRVSIGAQSSDPERNHTSQSECDTNATLDGPHHDGGEGGNRFLNLSI
jgi:hypothetical protein